MAIEIEKQEYTPNLPFSSLDADLRNLGWTEQIQLPQNGDNLPTRIISWPLSPEYTYVPNHASSDVLESEDPIKVREVTQEEIDKGQTVVPVDTWNLANFRNADQFRDDGIFKGTFLNQVFRYYEDIVSQGTFVPPSAICFSRHEKQIILLPIASKVSE